MDFQVSSDCQGLAYLWHKAENMERQLRIELTTQS